MAFIVDSLEYLSIESVHCLFFSPVATPRHVERQHSFPSSSPRMPTSTLTATSLSTYATPDPQMHTTRHLHRHLYPSVSFSRPSPRRAVTLSYISRTTLSRQEFEPLGDGLASLKCTMPEDLRRGGRVRAQLHGSVSGWTFFLGRGGGHLRPACKRFFMYLLTRVHSSTCTDSSCPHGLLDLSLGKVSTGMLWVSGASLGGRERLPQNCLLDRMLRHTWLLIFDGHYHDFNTPNLRNDFHGLQFASSSIQPDVRPGDSESVPRESHHLSPRRPLVLGWSSITVPINV